MDGTVVQHSSAMMSHNFVSKLVMARDVEPPTGAATDRLARPPDAPCNEIELKFNIIEVVFVSYSHLECTNCSHLMSVQFAYYQC